MNAASNMELLVSTDWLAAALGETDVVVADASWFLPEHGRDPAEVFAAGHIPGAIRLDLDALADETRALPMMLPEGSVLTARLAALGIAPDKRVVVYDDSPLHTAARAWWMVRAAGIAQVGILDGGLAKWRAEGRAIESGAAVPLAAGESGAPAEAGAVDLDAMRRLVGDPAVQVVDARGPARFAGAEPEPRPGVVPGHMPGAINLPYARLFNADGTWKRGEALVAAFAEAGIDLDKPVVATCGSGVTAAVIVVGLKLLGHEARLYDGSWAEWGADPSTAKVTGA